MILIIDAGNTNIKIAVFEHNTLLFKENSKYENWKLTVKNIFILFPNCLNVAISNVGKLSNIEFKKVFVNNTVFFITKDIQFPFHNKYQTPLTLGIDRLVLASGATIQFPNQNRLIIDAGTCITYDFVDFENNYLGGAISPGIQMRYQSLNNYTAKLPLLEKKHIDQIIGNSTENSIHSGVINSIIFEIEGFINHKFNENENFIIILTGGDSDFLAKRLKNTIFANSNFLLESLNQLYQFNQND